LEDLIDKYEFRKTALISAKIYPKLMIINQDMNLESTIWRATKMKHTMSLKLILTAVFDRFNTLEYQKLIMFDLDVIWNSKNSEFIPFFGRSASEIRDTPLVMSYCNMEVPLRSSKLKHFTNKKIDVVKI
jgi:hypothetical protein